LQSLITPPAGSYINRSNTIVWFCTIEVL